MTKPTLWISPGACSLAPHILLNEAGVDYELITIDITKGGFPEEYRKINPKGRVPILDLGNGTIITEVPAVITAIAQMRPDKHLLGKTNLDIVRSYEWFNWLSGTLHERGLGSMFRPSMFAADEAAYGAVQIRARQTVDECFGLIEEKLSTIYSVGTEFSAVDVFLYVIYRWGYLMKLDMKALYPKWSALIENVVKQDSVVATTAKEGIPLVEDDREPPPVASKQS